ALTLLGIVIGVASVIVMLSIGLGTKQRVVAQMASMGATMMYLGGIQPADGGPEGVVTVEDLEAIAELPEVRAAMPVIGDPLSVRHGNVSRSVYTLAGSAELPRIH
ncbi:ABC transporter permease, partial [Escherichia coli]|uniref:ABC transporter permease n=2 Tax=Gammaproteobacteria TaxID=1236 RepID=UPI0012C3ADCF